MGESLLTSLLMVTSNPVLTLLAMGDLGTRIVYEHTT